MRNLNASIVYQCMCMFSILYIHYTMFIYLIFTISKTSCVFSCVSLKINFKKTVTWSYKSFSALFFSNLCILISVFNRILAMYGGKNANKNICLYWTMNKIYTSNLNATPPIMTFMVRKLIISGGWREILGCYSILPIPTRTFLLFHYSHPLPTLLFHYSTGKLPLFLFCNSSLTHKIIKVDLQRLGKII